LLVLVNNGHLLLIIIENIFENSVRIRVIKCLEIFYSKREMPDLQSHTCIIPKDLYGIIGSRKWFKHEQINISWHALTSEFSWIKWFLLQVSSVHTGTLL
jgi:hypothetical protein